MGVEIAGGIISSSIAIMTDAAHMLSDFCGFFISIARLLIYYLVLKLLKDHQLEYILMVIIELKL